MPQNLKFQDTEDEDQSFLSVNEKSNEDDDDFRNSSFSKTKNSKSKSAAKKNSSMSSPLGDDITTARKCHNSKQKKLTDMFLFNSSMEKPKAKVKTECKTENEILQGVLNESIITAEMEKKRRNISNNKTKLESSRVLTLQSSSLTEDMEDFKLDSINTNTKPTDSFNEFSMPLNQNQNKFANSQNLILDRSLCSTCRDIARKNSALTDDQIRKMIQKCQANCKDAQPTDTPRELWNISFAPDGPENKTQVCPKPLRTRNNRRK